jgi:hypothetical protein
MRCGLFLVGWIVRDLTILSAHAREVPFFDLFCQLLHDFTRSFRAAPHHVRILFWKAAPKGLKRKAG